MERMKAIKKNRKLHKKFYRAMGGFLITLVLLCAAGGNLFAKYYAGQKNKGVGVASSLYFSSNVLKKVASDSDIQDYPTIFNTDPWNGTDTCSIDVDIQNFQNQLLYNDENLDITYDISFSLEKSTDGGTYTVSSVSGSEGTTPIPDDGTAITFSGLTLQGGQLDKHQFKINVTRPDSESGNATYRSVGIKVMAKPVSPSFVSNSVTLGGIAYASMLSASYSLECIPNLDTDTSPSDYSGFPYVISYIPGEDQSAHDIKILWKKDILEIDQFDPYYLKLKEDSTKYGTEQDGNWQFLIFSIQPYSNVQITFYRKSTSVDYSSVGLSDCVKVIDLTKDAGGSGN